MKGKDKDIKTIFDRSFPMPAQEQTDATCERVFDRLNSADTRALQEIPAPAAIVGPKRAWWQLAPVRVAAAIAGLAILSVPFVKSFVMPESVYAVVEFSKGPVYSVSGEGKQQAVVVGDRIPVDGTVLRTEDMAGAVLAFSDGARVTVDEQTQLSLERAKDGVKIKISEGGARVTPAKEPARTLYLQNVAEVFQSAALVTAQAPAEPEPTFDVISIRPSIPPPGNVGNRGGPPSGTQRGQIGLRMSLAQVQLDPGRFVALRTTLQDLIGMAYGNVCLMQGMCPGAPDWGETEAYDVQATIPSGTPAYTKAELREGKAPKLQKMIQNMLASRFKLSVRRESKEMAVYNLIVTKPEKLTPAADPAVAAARAAEVRRQSPMFGVSNSSLSNFAGVLQGQVGRPVLDKTNLKGQYDFLMVLSDQMPLPPSPPDAAAGVLAQLLNGTRDAIVSRLEDQLGLKLEPARAQVEVVIVERAERPSEN